MSELDIKSECTTLIKWKVANFSTVAASDDSDKFLSSDFFKLDSSEIKCYLRFDPTNNHDSGDRHYSSIYLYVSDLNGNSGVKLHIKFWIENELGDKIAERPEIERVFEDLHLGWGYPEFVHHDILYLLNNQFVKNDIVFICCQIVHGNYLPKLQTQFNQQLWNSYKEGFTGECTLKVSDIEFKISKTILTAQSDMFKTMLKSEMKEGSTGVIEMNDFDVKTIEAFVEYLHLESVSNLNDFAFELFYFADEYNISGLKTQCEESLVKTINNDNFRDLLILAFMHNSNRVKSAVLEYISKSQDGIFTSMMMSNEWINFSYHNKKLASDITTAVFHKLGFKK